MHIWWCSSDFLLSFLPVSLGSTWRSLLQGLFSLVFLTNLLFRRWFSFVLSTPAVFTSFLPGLLDLCCTLCLVHLHCREQIPCKVRVRGSDTDSFSASGFDTVLNLPGSMVDHRTQPFFSDFLIAHPFINAHSLGLACYCIRHVLSEEMSSFLMS